MITLWSSLDANQTLALACGLTLLGGLCIGAAWSSWLIRRVPRVVTDNELDEYREAADEVYDWSATPIFDDLALAALKRDLDEWGSRNG